ncbi:MAG: ROK family protein [Terriglobia bacterium]
MARYALAVDLGGTKTAVARVSDAGKITHRLIALTPAAGGKAVLESMIHLLRQLPAQGVCAVGVGVPGLAYPDGTVWAPNIPGWQRMPVATTLTRRFKLPTVVDSDRNAFVTGEAWKGIAQKRRDVIYVAIGTGIGAGIISGGRLLRGHGELAGCIGWMAVRHQFLPGYKSVGCLEFHAAGPGIAREAQHVFKRDLSTRDVVRLARGGDSRARAIMTRAGVTLGLALANLVDTLSPEMIVIGGGAAAAGKLLIGPARQTMRKWAQPVAVKQVQIRRSRLGGRACLLGAAKLAFDQLAP